MNQRVQKFLIWCQNRIIFCYYLFIYQLCSNSKSIYSFILFSHHNSCFIRPPIKCLSLSKSGCVQLLSQSVQIQLTRSTCIAGVCLKFQFSSRQAIVPCILSRERVRPSCSAVGAKVLHILYKLLQVVCHCKLSLNSAIMPHSRGPASSVRGFMKQRIQSVQPYEGKFIEGVYVVLRRNTRRSNFLGPFYARVFL